MVLLFERKRQALPKLHVFHGISSWSN